MTKEIPLVQRYYGSETEYSFTMSRTVQPQLLRPDTLIPPNFPHYGQFLGNGSRLYPDNGLIEYATPECSTLTELVTHELAGESIVVDALVKVPEITALFKRASDPHRIYTYGSHENYSTTVDIWSCEKDPKISTLASHFATRTIFIGAGTIGKKNKFELSQKMADLVQVAGSESTRHKALVNTRDEPLNRSSDVKRLHVVCGDANMSPWAIKMKFGTTSLVLRLLEHKMQLNVALEDPLKAAWTVAGGVRGLTAPLPMFDGHKATAIEVQRYFLEKCVELSNSYELPAEEMMVIAEWAKVLDALQSFSETGDEAPILYQLDWFVRMKTVERARSKSPSSTGRNIRNYDVGYDLIPNGIGAGLRNKTNIFSSETPSDEDIERATQEAPNGRAKMRGKAIKENSTRPYRKRLKAVVWDCLITDRVELSMPLDRDYSDDAIDSSLAELFR